MWRSVTITCKPGFEDIVSLSIFESGFSGLIEKTDSSDPCYTAYYLASSEKKDPLAKLTAALKKKELKPEEAMATIVAVEDVPDEDWESAWRKGLGALEIGERLVVRPSWVDYDNEDGRVDIVIDPKMAFGTGSHETTRLCLEFLERTNLKDVSVLDVGCGSGVLSIAAVKLGARCAIGFDNDHDSVLNADENIRANRVHDYITVYQGDLATVEPGHFNLVLANLISSALLPNLKRFHRFLMPGGWVVFSGLLAEEEKEFRKQLSAAGFRVRNVTCLGEWIAIEVESIR